MTPQRIAGFCFWFVITSAAAAAQQQGEATSTHALSGTSVSERTYPTDYLLPLRRVERTTASGATKIIIETAEEVGVEGRWAPVEEVQTQTIRTGNTTGQTKRDVFLLDSQGRRRLAETTQTDQRTGANGDTRRVQNTWVAGLDGGLTLSSGEIEETKVPAPGIRQTDTTRLTRSPEGSLRGADRVRSTEQQVNESVVRHDTTHLIGDVNGQWLPTEARRSDSRGVGSAERVEEETIERPNLNGTLVPSDTVVTRRSESNGQIQVMIETYSRDAEGYGRTDAPPALTQRVRTSTTATPDGGRSTVEEIEARNPVAPNDPMRVTRRTVVTVRSVGPGRSVTERQMFERDPNGRMVLVANDTEDTTDK